jgi:hypothetical protein
VQNLELYQLGELLNVDLSIARYWDIIDGEVADDLEGKKQDPKPIDSAFETELQDDLYEKHGSYCVRGYLSILLYLLLTDPPGQLARQVLMNVDSLFFENLV